MSGSLISIIRLFNREGSVNCVTVRSGGEQTCAIPIGHNESEPHLMSLDILTTREPSFLLLSEGRRELSETNRLEYSERSKQSATIHHSGGVGEGSMSGSVSRRSRETLQSEGSSSTANSSPSKGKVCRTLQGVRVLHSSEEVSVMETEQRRGTYVDAIPQKERSGDGGQQLDNNTRKDPEPSTDALSSSKGKCKVPKAKR